ncbi:unnamed protein product, partial [marine sediment metagenome]
MTKQEEIRKGIARAICVFRDEPKECKVCEETGGCPQWGDVQENTERVIQYLHSQDVVIKVERELPKNPIRITDSFGLTEGEVNARQLGNDCFVETIQDDMLMAGFGAFEPLIK